MTTSDMNAVCSQLLRPEDLTISDELFKQVQTQSVVTQIVEKGNTTNIKIYSTYQLYLSSVTPILHDIGFLIIDEVTYNIQNGKDMIYVSRFNLRILKDDFLEKIKDAKENLENIITMSIKDLSFNSSKVFSLVLNQNFNQKKIKLVRSFIEYLDQAVLTINSVTILNTYTLHHSITKLFVDYFYAKFDPSLKKRKELMESIKTEIEEKIKTIPQIIDDRILKLTLSLLDCLLRTNYFMDKESVAFKINSLEFGKNLKGLQPNLENFIYHDSFY